MLKSVLMTEWNNISSNEARRIVQSMPKQLAGVLKHKGYPTRYYISFDSPGNLFFDKFLHLYADFLQ